MPRIPVIKTVNLCKYFQMGKEVVKAIHKVNLEVYAGEFVLIFGPSGCGKSTLMSLLAGLDEPTSGEVYIRGEKLSDLGKKQLARYRRTKIGMVFQQYNLIKSMNVVENVSLPLTFDGVPKHRRTQRARNVIELVGMGEYYKHTPAELSGGQQQRISIARAWVASPWIVFADEPTGNLDSKSSDTVMRLLRDLSKKSKRTVAFITHNPEYKKLADRVVYLKDGMVVKVEGEIKAATKKKTTIEKIKGIGKKAALELRNKGFDTIEAIAEADPADLSKIPGISEGKAEKIIAQAKEMISAGEISSDVSMDSDLSGETKEESAQEREARMEEEAKQITEDFSSSEENKGEGTE